MGSGKWEVGSGKSGGRMLGTSQSVLLYLFRYLDNKRAVDIVFVDYLATKYTAICFKSSTPKVPAKKRSRSVLSKKLKRASSKSRFAS